MRTVKCPTCGKPASFDPSNSFRPFCSERCQVLDLGAWADEKFKIASPENTSEGVNENSEEVGSHSTEESSQSFKFSP